MADVQQWFQVRRIGTVRDASGGDMTRYTDPGSVRLIEIDPAWVPALEGIEGYSHLVVLCLHDRARKPGANPPLIHPEGRADMPAVGIFASRTPHRPNPIALSCPILLGRDGNRLVVSGLDAWDGTPVLDIKGYAPRSDSHPEATVPGWLVDLWAMHDRERGS